jgi:cysteine desulfurase
MTQPIYLDNHSTTPVDPQVLEAMLPFFKETFGNAASKSHAFGNRAEAAVETARAQIAKLIGANSAEEIIFTSGATESNNLALRGFSEMYRERGNHIITCKIEHHAVLDTCRFLETQGFKITYLPVNAEGLVDANGIKKAITKETILISIMHANNEIGTVQPLQEIGALAHEKKIAFHTDAAQSVGKIPVNVTDLGAHLLSFSGHKIYGPKGVGALYVRSKNPRIRLASQMQGGGHEGGLRSGTLNVPGIVGLGKACKLAACNLDSESKQILKLRERLRNGICSALDQVYVNGSVKHRLPGNLNLSFEFVEGGALMKELCPHVAVSSGSACSSASPEPSYVLKALGMSEARTHTSVRFGLGRFTTEAEIDVTIKKTVEIVNKLRAASPLYEKKS